MTAHIRRVGGIWHWRIGRLGGSVYLASPQAAHRTALRKAKAANTRRLARVIAQQRQPSRSELLTGWLCIGSLGILFGMLCLP